MKRKLNKVLVGIITLTMIVSSTGLAFADQAPADKTIGESFTKGGAEVVNAADSELVGNTDIDVNMSGKLKPKAATPGNNFTVTQIKKGTEFNNATVDYIYYDIVDDVLDYPEYCGYSQPVYLKKGTVIMSGLVIGEESAQYWPVAYFGLFRDQYMNNPVEEDIVGSDREDEGGTNYQSASNVVIQVPADGTYYLGVYSYAPNEEYSQLYGFAVSTCYLSGANRTVYSGSKTAVGQKNAQDNIFTFKATKTGYIKIATTDVKTKFRLYSSSGTARSKQSVGCNSIVYGVKKGYTYKIKVYAPYNAAGGYVFSLTNTGVSEYSGSTKSKAKTIYRGSSKAKKGCIIAGSSTPDWYKFKLTSSKAVNIKMTGATNETLKIGVYKGSKLIKTCSFKNTTKSVLIKSVGKWSKGTYYIKVYRGSSTSSGHYKVYWYYR